MKEKTGLWKRQSKKGTNYYSGKIKIGEKEYNIAVFKNDKDKDTQPDLMLYLNEKEVKETTPTSFTPDDVVYADFGNLDEVKDEDIAF